MNISTIADIALSKVENIDISFLGREGILFPDTLPKEWNVLPDEWDRVMEEKGILNLHDHELSVYLERWLRLLGHAYWVRGIKEANILVLERAADHIKDIVFSSASGGREQKAAVAGSNEQFLRVDNALTECKYQLTILNGIIYKWEKIEFSISRTITNRSGRPLR